MPMNNLGVARKTGSRHCYTSVHSGRWRFRMGGSSGWHWWLGKIGSGRMGAVYLGSWEGRRMVTT